MNIEQFKMLDTISHVSTDDRILTGSTRVPEISKIFDFHFPNYPVMPGVLLIEVMAQAAGYLAMMQMELKSMAVLAKVSHCKFVDFVQPGDVLEFHIKMLRCENGFTVNKGEIRRNNTMIATAELRMKLIKFPNETAQKILIKNFQELTGDHLVES